MVENERTKCITFGEALGIRVKKFKQNLPENYSKSTKIASTLQYKNFLIFFSEEHAPVPLNQLQICSAEKKIDLKKMWKLCPSFKIFCCATAPRIR